MRRMASLNLLLPTSSFRIDPDEVIGQVHVSSQPSQQTSSIYYIIFFCAIQSASEVDR